MAEGRRCVREAVLMKKPSFLLLVAGVLLIPGLGWPHAYITDDSDIKARGTDMKDPPCGVNVRSLSPTPLTAGSTITVRWAETVDHTGSYWIEFSACGDANWVRLKTIADTQNGGVPLPHLYSQTITVPNVNCDKCTIRVVQEMIDNHPDFPTYYYSCADIRITGAK